MKKLLPECRVSRRTVLKTAGLSATIAALGIDPYKACATVFTAAEKVQKEELHYGFCRMCMRGMCANRVYIKNDVVVNVDGNPECPMNKGALCAKGQAIVQNHYNPYRVKAPMKRTNPKKGLNEDPQWVEISWEEALNTTATKLKEVREKDPRRFIYQVGFGDMDFFCTFMFYFAQGYGTPNYLKSNGTLCTLHFGADMTQGTFPGSTPDLTKTKYMMMVGGNFGMGIATTGGGVRGLMKRYTEDKDLKIVIVDPHCGPDASKTEWVPIKPGGELAMLMGMVHTVFYEIKKMDFEFLKWKANASYLIGPDGHYFRGKDGKPQIYDESDKKVKSFDDKTLKDPSLTVEKLIVDGVKTDAALVLVKRGYKTNTPEWAEKISGISAAKIREMANDYINSASLGETMQLKNGKGETLTLPVRTSICLVKRGVMNQRDGTSSDLTARMLNLLVGAVDVPGGLLGCERGPYPLSPDEDGVVKPKWEAMFKEPTYPPQHLNLHEYFPHKHTLPTLAYKVAADPKKYGLPYEIDALLTVGSNPIASTAEPYVVADSVAKIPFSATIAYEMDEMAHMSDILLPSHSMLERESVNVYTGSFDYLTKELLNVTGLLYRDPVVPIYSTRQPQDIIIELCDRIGMINEFNEAVNNMGVMMSETVFVRLDENERLKPNKRYTIGEIWDKASRKLFNKPLDEIRKTGMYMYEMEPADVYNSSWYKKGETRHPVYFERLLKSGEGLRKFWTENKGKVWQPYDLDDQLAYYEPVIQWRSKKILEVKKGDKFNLIGINWKAPTSLMRMGGIDHLSLLNEISGELDPAYGNILINPVTAAEKGVTEGDMVWIESKVDKIRGRLHVSETIVPEVVGVGGALGRLVDTLGKKATKYPMFNKLLSAEIEDCDAISIGVSISVPVRIYKA